VNTPLGAGGGKQRSACLVIEIAGQTAISPWWTRENAVCRLRRGV